MDLQDWEVLADEGFIDLHVDHKVHPDASTVIDPREHDKLDEIPGKEVTQLPIKSSQFDDENQINDKNMVVLESKSDDHEMGSQVFLENLKERNEFVDMKMVSPRCLNRELLAEFEEKEQKDGSFEKEEHREMNKLKNRKKEEEGKNEGLKVWKWAMTGMGALVSFGFAAATVSLIVFSDRHNQINNSKKKELHFQSYSHDKRLRQVVRHAKKLNEAITVMRGATINRANITIGGYYEHL